jgi:PIN domain nuclease of toxin-antitoxin system
MTRYQTNFGWGMMKLLLDSHAFMWWDNNLGKLSPTVLALCQEPGNTLLLSVASVWEMQIKEQLGKLKLPLALGDMVSNHRKVNHLEVVPINLEHVLALNSLPMHHKDPFDRLLIAQANIEGALLLSRDPIFALYPVNVQ